MASDEGASVSGPGFDAYGSSLRSAKWTWRNVKYGRRHGKRSGHQKDRVSSRAAKRGSRQRNDAELTAEFR